MRHGKGGLWELDILPVLNFWVAKGMIFKGDSRPHRLGERLRRLGVYLFFSFSSFLYKTSIRHCDTGLVRSGMHARTTYKI